VDLEALGNFIRVKKPHVIVIGGESREALMIQEELKRLCVDISQEEQVPKIKVEIVDNQLAKVFANSIKGMVIPEFVLIMSSVLSALWKFTLVWSIF